ncbi:hypothetical protein KCP74_11470 [Salmonella enterica subsp. enterica]|nr:hypothetical protein KCP74_11470 [Salmonella enterica subsp. enterica]
MKNNLFRSQIGGKIALFAARASLLGICSADIRRRRVHQSAFRALRHQRLRLSRGNYPNGHARGQQIL